MLERIKPLQGLVSEMLDHLPGEVWTSETTTFLDPAIGGGQFVREVERRLQQAGHSDENIRARVFGFENSWALVHMAINMNKLVGQYTKVAYEEFFRMGTGMKFDVIVGNPPYQSEKGTGTQPLWPLFVYKAASLLTDAGYLSMITPNKWCGHTTNVIKGGIHLYTDILKGHLLNCNIQECSKHFPKIGGYENCFSYFIASAKESESFDAVTLSGKVTLRKDQFDYLPISMLSDLTASILAKIKSDNSYEFRQVSTGFENQNTGCVVISMAQRLHYEKLNIYLDKDAKFEATSKSTVSRKKFSRSSQKKVASVFRSKLFKFIHQVYWNNDNFGTSFYNALPYVDLNKLWTDKELYDHFGLTQEERDYIESNVK